MARHDFEPLNISHHELENKDEMGLDQWLLIVDDCGDYGLWHTTNVDALFRILQNRFGEDLVVSKETTCGGYVILADPSATELLELAHTLLDHVREGNHLDEDLYTEALDEAVNEGWECMNWSERIDRLQALDIDLSHIADMDPPHDLRMEMQEGYEHN